MSETRGHITLPVSVIQLNKGQIEGLPKNPRFIRDERYAKLKKSIEDAPEMLDMRTLIVVEHGDKYVAICGNMRLRACLELGYKELPCYVLPASTSAEKLREYTIKDNIGYGQDDWDLITNEWNEFELEAWGMEFPVDLNAETEEPKEADEDDFTDEDEAKVEAKTQQGEVWKLGNHRLMCGDSLDTEHLDKLMGDVEHVDLIVTDPPYNVAYESDNKVLLKNRGDGHIANDHMSDGKFLQFLTDAFANASRYLKVGGSFYIWHSDSEGLNFRQAVKNVGLDMKQCLIWNKNALVLGRQDYQWRHEPCQPAGTLVLMADGTTKPIETITDGDHVVGFNTYSGQVKGFRNGGYEVKTASRHYNGKLYSISAAGKITQATDNHQFSVRVNPDCRKNYCTYLMYRDGWWRVGHTVCYDSQQFGLKSRAHTEDAEAAWIIETFPSRAEAQIAEQLLAIKYGIPYIHWETEANHRHGQRTTAQIQALYEALDAKEQQSHAERLLSDYGRDVRFPLYAKGETGRFSTRVSARINACNLIPELMQVPIHTEGSGFEWATISAINTTLFDGEVYSLAVETYEHYISDGIITHNCLYGWKPGASHYFIDKRDLTTVIDMNKPQHSDLHPTMKPIALFAQHITNSSKAGEVVLDMFGGSGTTIIACEQLGRKCYTMEYDPHFCDVIIARWEKLTGGKAEKVEDE